MRCPGGWARRVSQSLVRRGQENQWRKGRLATHLMVLDSPKLPQKNAKEGNNRGNDKGGQGKEGDVVEGTCHKQDKGVSTQRAVGGRLS